MSRHNLDIVDQAFDAYFDGDLDRAADLIAPDVVVTQLEELPDPGTFVGRRGFREVIEAWEEPWDDFHVERLNTIDLGDHVLVTVRQTGRGRGSGVEVEGVYTFLFSFRDGKLARWRMFADEANALEAAA